MIAVLCPFGLDGGLLSRAVSFGQPLRVLIPEADAQRAAELGAETIHICNIDCADDRAVALWLAERLDAWEATVVLSPATVRMRGIMPLLAWEMQAGLTADCTGIRLENGQLLQTRPAFGNSLMADIQSCSRVQMATVRPGIFAETEKTVTAKITKEAFTPVNTCVRMLKMHTDQAEKPLQQAKIILAGGGGIGSREGFEKLEKLAKRLGAAVAASRNAVDAGFAPYRCQVGMTGVTVCPKLYIAVGISGAVQHIAGMSGAEKIIAINKDPKAPIFDYADYGIVGDWERVIEELEAFL